MANYDDDTDDASTDKDSIEEAVEWFKFVETTETDQIEQEAEDLSFQLAEGAWPESIRSQFNAIKANSPGNPSNIDLPARPRISIASLDEPISLVSAEQRKAHLAVRIHPLSEDADDETAQILQGLYRQIERDSRADIARGWAADRCLWAGRGAYRIDCVYDPYGGHELDQKILINRILDQSTVKRDPYAQQPDWSDGTRLMIAVPISLKTFKRKYPKSKVAGYDDRTFDTETSNSNGWLDSGTGENRSVRVCEDWRVEITERKKVLLDNGEMAFEDEIPAGRKARTGKDARSRNVTERHVFWRIINYCEVLQAEQEWDGQYIPVASVIGRELQPTKGKRGWIGMVTNAKGAVRLTDYAASNAVRMAALEPRAPYHLDPRQIEGFEKWWEQLNTRDFPYLPSHAEKDGVRFEKPERTQVDVSRLGPSMQLLTMGKGFVETATAIRGPALGEQTPAHRSGRAIVALQDQSVQSNSPYLDNLANISMTYEAMVILDIIPKKYDRPGRIARILDKKEVASWIMLNHPFVPGPNGRPQALPYDTPEEKQAADVLVNDPQHPAKHYDLSKGRYGVEVTIGKGWKDERDEGVGEMGAILQSDPAMMQVIGPEYFNYRGEPWAENVATLLEKNRDHVMPWLAKNPQQVDPMKLQAENAMLQQQLQAAMKAIETKQIEAQSKEKIAAMQEGAESERAAKDRETKIAVAEIAALAKELADTRAFVVQEIARLGSQQHEQQMAGADRAHSALMATGDHQSDMAQAEQAQIHTMEQGNQAVAGQLAVQAAAPQPPNGSGE